MKRDKTHRNHLGHHRLDWDLRTAGEPRERVRVSAGRHHLGATSQPDAVPTQTDTMQNTRIDTLERAVRELTEGLILNRRAFATMLEELRETRSAGGSGQGLYVDNGYAAVQPDTDAEEFDLDHDHIIDRLHLIERSVDAKFNELARTWSVLGRRLDAMEEALAARAEPDATGLTPDVTEKIAVLPERLAALEQGIAAADAAGVSERLGAMERRILSSNASRLAAPAELTDKLDRIEVVFGALLTRLDTLEGNLGRPGDNTLDITPLAAGLKEIDARTSDTQLMIDTIDDRVRKVEELFDAQRSQLAQVSATVGSELKALTASVSAQGVGSERVGSLIEDGMRGVAQSFEQQKGGIVEAVAKDVAERFGILGGALRTSHGEQSKVLSALAERSGTDAQVLSMADSYQRDAGAMHDALRTINANQQRLAASMDQWHFESRNQNAELSDRLRALETAGSDLTGDAEMARPTPVHTAGSRPEGDRQRPGLWSRFRNWLFGTDDWFGASWGGRL